MAGPRICIFFARPAGFVRETSVDHPAVVIYDRHTLYPAAYPKPGNKEVNLRAGEAAEYCLKMTALRFAAELIYSSYQLNGF